MVISGEVSLALSAYTHIVYEAKDRGAPIDALIIEPLIGRVNGIGVSRKPPHPSAARLFYEYNIGESQPLMVKLHYFSPLKKMPSPLGNAKMVFVDLAMDSERCDAAYEKLIRGQDRK